MKIMLKDSNKYPLKVGENKNGDWFHLATLSRQVPNKLAREYMFFSHVPSEGFPNYYIEEIGLSGQLEKIEDNQVFAEIHEFLAQKGLLEIESAFVGKTKK